MLNSWDGRFIFSVVFYFLHWLFIWPKIVAPSVQFVVYTLSDWGMERAAGIIYFGFGNPIAYWVMLFVEIFLIMWLLISLAQWANKPDKNQKSNKRSLPS